MKSFSGQLGKDLLVKVLNFPVIKIFSTGGVIDSEKVEQVKMKREEIKVIYYEAHNAGLMVSSHVVCKSGVREVLLSCVDTIEHGAEMDDEIVELLPRYLA